jgi:hypothetical protein
MGLRMGDFFTILAYGVIACERFLGVGLMRFFA